MTRKKSLRKILGFSGGQCRASKPKVVLSPQSIRSQPCLHNGYAMLLTILDQKPQVQETDNLSIRAQAFRKDDGTERRRWQEVTSKMSLMPR